MQRLSRRLCAAMMLLCIAFPGAAEGPVAQVSGLSPQVGAGPGPGTETGTQTGAQMGDLKSEAPILAMIGRVTGGRVVLTPSDLDALPEVKIVTGTPWYDGPRSFEGPSLASVLEAAGASGSEFIVTAINGYSATIPVADVRTFNPVLARRINGATLSVRDKGPLFIVYPFDGHPEINNEVYITRSVWQVSEIEVR